LCVSGFALSTTFSIPAIDSGGVSGAFVNNGSTLEGKAGGVIGDFGIVGTGVLATGTIAGIRTETTPIPPPE
jgi:hypothetical protein